MARSMTGYGKAAFKNERFEITAEIRNLNDRYVDISIRVPKKILPYEFKLKDLIKSHVIRGKISLSISFKDLSEGSFGLSVNQDSLKEYYQFLESLKEQTGIEDDIKLDHLLALKDYWEPDESDLEDKEIERNLMNVVKEALFNLNEMRTR